MDRFHVRRVLREARLSSVEESSFVTGVLLVLAGALMAVAGDDPGGPARALGTIGLGVLGVLAIRRAVCLYRVNVAASLPRSVGRVSVRIRPGRVSTVKTAALALVLPAAAAVALVAVVDWGWIAIACGLLLGCLGVLVTAVRNRSGELPHGEPPTAASALLERLCMRADIPVPQLVVQPGPTANAWTTGGRVHLTTQLVRLLDESELEAVLAQSSRISRTGMQR
jgi:Zn-dependent protease with chaperone function